MNSCGSIRGICGRRVVTATPPGSDEDDPITLRWIYQHMVEEYARHNGHADLLRERIEGATGD